MSEATNTLSYNSATGASWQQRPVDERLSLTLSQKYDLPEIVSRILVSRGVKLEDVEDFLNPTIKNLLPDPLHLLDMEKAAERITRAICSAEKIAIFGDYDVDGATSSALLKRFLNATGNSPLIYIPDRIDEGYGPNTEAFLYLRKQGVGLCITVDCGTLSFEPIAAAKNAGMDVIVLDHHISTETLPEAHAVVNPNRLDESSEHKHLAAVGVAFLTAVAVNTKLRAKGWYKNRPAPDLISLLDIVALGTVCDVVPLKGVNRAFVSQGLKVMRSRENIGIKALADIAGIKDLPSSYHLGFVLGPRINAGGRVGKSDLGARLLSTENPDEAFFISQQLDRFNAERKALEQLVLEEAIAQIERGGTQTPLLFAKSQGWHPGVVGIVASRVTERFNKPCAIISLDKGLGKASARSIAGMDFGSAIIAANQNGLLVKGGGHAMAAGFTVEEGKIDELFKFLCDKFIQHEKLLASRIIKIDGHLQISAVTPEMANLINELGPFGTDNPEPRFIFPDVYLIKTDIIGGDHIRCIIGSSGNKTAGVKAMAFRSMDTKLGTALLNSQGKNIHIAGRIKLNSWQGVEKAELMIDDLAM